MNVPSLGVDPRNNKLYIGYTVTSTKQRATTHAQNGSIKHHHQSPLAEDQSQGHRRPNDDHFQISTQNRPHYRRSPLYQNRRTIPQQPTMYIYNFAD